MAINMSTNVYLPCQNTFGRPAVFTSATGNSFSGTARGIYKSDEIDIPLEGGSILTTQSTILDIRTDEFFGVLPNQDDTVALPAVPSIGLPDLGSFQIIDVFHNGGGEITLQLRAIVS
jgi:hypothetical protein